MERKRKNTMKNKTALTQSNFQDLVALNSYIKDGIHLSKAGNEVIMKYFENHMYNK